MSVAACTCGLAGSPAAAPTTWMTVSIIHPCAAITAAANIEVGVGEAVAGEAAVAVGAKKSGRQ